MVVALSPDQRAHPGEQFGKSEGLREVVIGAHVEAGHPVLNGSSCGQEQDRRAVAGHTESTADRESIEFGKHDVEDDEVIGRGARHEEPFFAVLREVHRIVFFAEPLLDEPCKVRVVFNN